MPIRPAAAPKLTSDIQRLAADLLEDQEKVHLACKDLIVEIENLAGTDAPFW